MIEIVNEPHRDDQPVGAALLRNLAYTAVAGLGVGGILSVLGYTIRHAQVALLGGPDIGENLAEADLTGSSSAFLLDLPASLMGAHPIWVVLSLVAMGLTAVVMRDVRLRNGLWRGLVTATICLLIFLLSHFARPVIGLRNVLILNAPDELATERERELWAYLACPVWRYDDAREDPASPARAVSNDCARLLGCERAEIKGRTLEGFYSEYVGGTLLSASLFVALLGLVVSGREGARRTVQLSLYGAALAINLWFLSYAYGKTKASLRLPHIEAMVSSAALAVQNSSLCLSATDEDCRGKIRGWVIGRRGERSVIYTESGAILELTGEDLGPVRVRESWSTVLDAHIRSQFDCSAKPPL